jgi:hypothetical protein
MRDVVPQVTHEAVVDHRLRRHALVADVRRGARPLDEVQDAPRELRQAAARLGEPAGEPCPVCDADRLVVVAFVEGPTERQQGRAQGGGRPVAADAVAALANRHGSVTLRAVEVCLACAWHHLRTTSRVRAVPPGAAVTASGA